MNVMEANAACAANGQLKEVGAFSKVFRTDELNNIVAGEQFTIPEDYKIYRQPITRGGQPVTDQNGDPVYAEFINVKTNTNRVVRFYPTSICKIAFPVTDDGRNLLENNKWMPVRSKGTLVNFAKGKAINDVMIALKGCTVECKTMTPVKVRRFGVKEEDATAKDVETNNIGEWNIIGKKKPVGWTD